MLYKKLLLQLGMLGTTITPISTIIACGTESTKEVNKVKKAVYDAKKAFDILVKTSSSSKLKNASTILASSLKEVTTSVGLGFTEPKNIFDMKITYKVKSTNDAEGTLVVEVTIKKEVVSETITFTLTGFQTKEVNDAQQKINDEINKATLPKIVKDANFKASRNLVKSDFDIQQPSDDSLTLEIQSVITSDDKITTITIKVSSNVEGTTPKTYDVTSFITKLKNPTEVSSKEFKDKILPKGFTIPNSITSIGVGAFMGATLPKNFILPNSITSIDEGAFFNAKLPKNFILPNSITSIGNGAFMNATLSQGFVLPNGITSISADVFRNVILPLGFTLPNGIISIGNYAFRNSKLPRGFTLPNGIMSISRKAFAYAILYEGFTIPNSVTSINQLAFYKVRLPKGCVWLDKNDVEISTPIAGARVDIKP